MLLTRVTVAAGRLRYTRLRRHVVNNQGPDVQAAAEAAIAERASSYLEQLTVERDAGPARDYYTEDARLLGPGMDLDQ